jgi:hypothetical protein
MIDADSRCLNRFGPLIPGTADARARTADRARVAATRRRAERAHRTSPARYHDVCTHPDDLSDLAQ